MYDLDTTLSVTSNSPYIDASNLTDHMKTFKNNFTVLTLNIQSLLAKFDKLTEFLSNLASKNFFFSAICLQESWLSDQNIDMNTFNIPNYNIINLGATVSKHGGLITYLHSSFQYKILDAYAKSRLWEGLFLEVTKDSLNKKVILGNIYRPPKDRYDDIRSFINEYCSTLSNITNTKHDTIIAEDFNIDLLQVTNRVAFSEYLDNMLSLSLSPALNLPTRFSKYKATLIDHIFCKSSNQQPIQGGIILKTISDHYPAFIALNNKTFHTTPTKFITVRHSSPQAEARFKADIESTNFSSLLNHNVNIDPSSNLEILNSVLINAKNKHLAQKTVKFNRHKHKMNPWMSFGILKSIKYRDSLYKHFHQLNPDSEEYSIMDTNLKTYNRILNRSIRNAKFSYYNNLLTAYKNDSKKTWETLRNIMNLSRTTTDFPKFFVINNNKNHECRSDY